MNVMADKKSRVFSEKLGGLKNNPIFAARLTETVVH
jgi:hypothetical protein